jgi:creatinine amidohydrolase
VDGCRPPPDADVPFMSFEEAEEVWQHVAARSDEWRTLRE